MFICEVCGQEGGCFTPQCDELATGGRFHPLCYASRGGVTYESCSISANSKHVRRNRSHGLLAEARTSVRYVRLAVGNAKKPVPFKVRRL